MTQLVSLFLLDLVVLSTFVRKYIFASNLSFPGRSHVGSLFASEEQKKGWLVTHLMLLTHILAILMG